MAILHGYKYIFTFNKLKYVETDGYATCAARVLCKMPTVVYVSSSSLS